MALLREGLRSKESTLLNRVKAPDFKLVGGYSADNSSRFSSTVNRNETVVGLKLDIPFGDTKSSADYQISKVELLKSQIQRKNKSIEFEKLKEMLSKQLKQAREQIRIDSEKIRLTKLIIKDEEKRFSIGKIDLEALIQLKSDYATYRTQQDRSKFLYGQTLIDYLAMYDALSVDEVLNY